MHDTFLNERIYDALLKICQLVRKASFKKVIQNIINIINIS